MSDLVCRPITDEERSYILSHFSYRDGEVFRNDRTGGTGSIDAYGYRILKIKGRQYKYHRIVWLLNTGEYPTQEIDHIDRNKLNNTFTNLRLSNRQEQNRNKVLPPNPITGAVGIHYDKTRGLRKHYAFSRNGRTFRYHTLEEAIREKEKNV